MELHSASTDIREVHLQRCNAHRLQVCRDALVPTSVVKWSTTPKSVSVDGAGDKCRVPLRPVASHLQLEPSAEGLPGGNVQALA